MAAEERYPPPLVLMGDSGTGKSHLLIGMGTVMAEAGLAVRPTTTSTLVNELAKAEAAKRLTSAVARCGKVVVRRARRPAHLQGHADPDRHRLLPAQGHRGRCRRRP